MNKQALIDAAVQFIRHSDDNNLSGMIIFDEPLLGFASADDELFLKLKDKAVIGNHLMLPKEWLPGAKTVISFFLPFSDEVKNGNKKDMSWPSIEWLKGRIEGQAVVNKLCAFLENELEKAGYPTLSPCLDKRFWSNKNSGNVPFTSNWSERHAAFICGLGTFGLSKGLITRKGIAGRFGSLITELYIEPDKRDYNDIYEYCTMCGSCVKNCPVSAISIKDGKNHVPCSAFQDITAEKYKPRYGCGKCQVNVPCESRIPRKTY